MYSSIVSVRCLHLVCGYGRAPYPARPSFGGITRVPHIQESQHTPVRNIMIRMICCVTWSPESVLSLLLFVSLFLLPTLISALLCAYHSSPQGTCPARWLSSVPKMGRRLTTLGISPLLWSSSGNGSTSPCRRPCHSYEFKSITSEFHRVTPGCVSWLLLANPLALAAGVYPGLA